jgi:HAMP domain-containing protein/CheY-like chemotaxis protein/signal transduction histidine kinase
MGTNGTTVETERTELLEALDRLGAGDYSVRLPNTPAAFDPEVIERLNRILKKTQEEHEEARQKELDFAVRERELVQELDSLEMLPPDKRRAQRERNELLRALQAAEMGRFEVRIRSRHVDSKVAKSLNHVIALNEAMAEEFKRVGRLVGKEGKLGERAKLTDAKGSWGVSVDAINTLVADLVQPTIEVARVIGSVAQGNLSQTMPTEIEGRPVKGAFLEMAKTINTMVGQLKAFASEVTRVAREVGTEGKLGGQAEVQGVAGVWKDLTDNVNSMASNLTGQVRNIAEVTTAVAQGDLSRQITVEVKGEILKLKVTINTMVDRLRAFAGEVTRVAREVGTEGKLGGQAEVKGVAGVWKDLTDNVNSMASNLTNQVRNIAEVTTAVANGDLSKKITVEVKGEILKLKETINTMVEQLRTFAGEVTRVAREVGTEGKLGGQAEVKGVGGAWKDLTDNVNSMASNLTNQVRNIAEVTTAVANGDLSKKITVKAKGEILKLKDTINIMVDQLKAFASEVTRVAREVGTEGKLGGQAVVKGVGGVWKDLTDNVNSMASNLTSQVRNIAAVTTAVADGDLSKKITVEVKGEILKLKETINTMVDQLKAFASEVTRVAREVGTAGKLGGQAKVKGVAGVWKDLTDNVNSMASNLTNQVRNIAEVTTAVAKGDLSKKITVPVQGEILRLKKTINTMVDQLNSFAGEVTRVAREVGTEGKLGGQAKVPGVAGTWKDLTDNVNFMASNLTNQVRNIAEVTTAVANGDLSKKITVEVKGEILELKNTINTMVEQLRAFAGEVTRVAREVGTEGKLGGQAEVKGVGGAWKDLTDNVNSMASNLTNQVRNIAGVTTAVARGDLSQKITVEVKGELLQLKVTINTMVDQLNSFASEVARVAREVGTEGKLGGQADVRGVGGAWKDLTDNVNFMASNLTNQVRNIAEVTTAVAKGDLSRKITVEAKGEILQLKSTVNTMVDQLNAFAEEVTRVAREVGTEGKLGGQAVVKGVAGVWKDLTDNVNSMASNLTSQVRNIADVTTAVAKGDLSQKITVEVKGELLRLKGTINTMVDQLNSFAGEVARVAREVGTEGKLGGQAQVKGVAGSWKDLTDNVNFMASNLTNQVRNIADVTTAIARGDLSKKITVEAKGEILELKNTINTTVDQLNAFAGEVTRVAREVGTEGKLGGQAEVKGVAGVWKDLTDNVNFMASNLTGQVRNIAEVTTAVARGDLSRKITVQAKGEILQLKDTINTMVDQLNAFGSEVTRVAREVGTEGKLGGQARVQGVAGAWKDLTDNVNSMASNLTSQVRNIADVTTAVAKGDLAKKITVEVKGELLELKNTINTMVDQLNAFAGEVTRVAREVGTEGKLGGQALVKDVAGTWKDLTDNVNELANNLTNQVRAIKDVATAVTKGDLTRSITIDARGEVEVLKDHINEMIRNLRETTQKNAQQDWLKTNLAKFSRMLQGQRELQAVAQQILSELAGLVDAQHGVFYTYEDAENPEEPLHLVTSYGGTRDLPQRFKLGETLIGQSALGRHKLVVDEWPADGWRVDSSLAATKPGHVVVLPVLFEKQVKAVIALSSFKPFSEVHQTFFDQLTELFGIVLNTIAATLRTEDLLKRSQALTTELQHKNTELTEKAEQLQMTSKYKSDFLANMSHELRTPLNSLLILSKSLWQNVEGNLTTKQVEQAKTINNAGSDLLALINDILDLSKIESGTMSVDVAQVRFKDIHDDVAASFKHVALQKKLEFDIDLDPDLPTVFETDSKRIQQVLRNLLSNAFKFTAEGKVQLHMGIAPKGWSRDNENLNTAEMVLFFSVKDSGIGIPPDKHQVIFEPFQQADTSTSRKYGGTGLGLSISREVAKLLGGEIKLESTPNQGSTFTLFLPRKYVPVKAAKPAKDSEDAKESSAAAPGLVPAIREEVLLVPLPNDIEDDRANIQAGDHVFLIVEDDITFASLLLEMSREHGFKCLIAFTGETGLAMAKRFKPQAISLDLRLPDMEGWALLDYLKHDPELRHIPVQVLSGGDHPQRALRMGAFSYLRKPVEKEDLVSSIAKIKTFLDRQKKSLLVVEDNQPEREHLIQLLSGEDIEASSAATAQEAMELLKSRSFDCMVVDLKLPDMSGLELIERVKREPNLAQLPVIVHTGKDLAPEEEKDLDRMTNAIVLKDVRSPDRLVQEVALFLHRSTSGLATSQRKAIETGTLKDPALAGKTVLIVDDDMRNIYALTTMLEQGEMNTLYAQNGRKAIEELKSNSSIDIVLMDIMMPEMDGYTAMKEIRKDERFKDLPIIALTAKAMKGDRERCMDAGASDYIPKPVDTERLLSLLRVWIYKGE